MSPAGLYQQDEREQSEKFQKSKFLPLPFVSLNTPPTNTYSLSLSLSLPLFFHISPLEVSNIQLNAEHPFHNTFYPVSHKLRLSGIGKCGPQLPPESTILENTVGPKTEVARN